MKNKTSANLRPICTLATLLATNVCTSAFARDAVVTTGTDYVYSEFGIEISGSTGPLLLPGPTVSFGNQISDAQPYTITSIASSGGSVYLTTRHSSPNTTRLYKTNLNGGPLTLMASDFGGSIVVAGNNTPYLIQNDPSINKLRFLEPDSQGIFVEIQSHAITSSDRGFLAGFNDLTNEFVILTSDTPSFKPLILSSISLNSASIRSSEIDPPFSLSGIFPRQINIDSTQNKAYISYIGITPNTTVDLSSLAEIPESIPTHSLRTSTGKRTSDVIDVDYGPDHPAIVDLSFTIAPNSTSPTLIRKPVDISVLAEVTNHAIPDNTTLHSVSVASFFPNGLPTGISVIESVDTFDSLSDQTIGGYTLHVDPSQVDRGVYQATAFDTQLTADYQSNGEFQSRNIHVNAIKSHANMPHPIAVDPISENFVGNGDMQLGTAGYTSHSSDFLRTIKESDNQFLQISLSSHTHTKEHDIQADIQLGIPDEESVFSLDYRLASEPGSLTRLHDFIVQIVDSETDLIFEIAKLHLITKSDGFKTISTLLDPEDLTDFVNPELHIRFTSQYGNDAYLHIDNMSWTSVPEPTGLIAGIGLTGGLIMRPTRRRRRAS